MSDSTDFSSLSGSWRYWTSLAGIPNVQVSEAYSDRQISFTSDDHSVHLRADDGWWVVDTVDDRGQLHSDSARFTTYDLVEKYLLWQWSSAARNILRLPRIGPKLYSLGHDSNVQFLPINEGNFELRAPEGRAVLMEPAATILSHLMGKSLGEIEELVKRGSGLR